MSLQELKTAIDNEDALQVALLLRNVPKADISDMVMYVCERYGELPFILSILLEHGADVNMQDIDGWTPLHHVFPYVENIKLLINNGADINAKNCDWCTPLHYTSRWGHVECAKLLIDLGADVSIKNREEKTALDLAKERKHTKVAQLLENVQNKST